MKVAYADPPYFKQGRKLYAKHHPQAADWDRIDRHKELIEQLTTEFPDGWAMSASSPSLPHILPLCPSDIRIGAWAKSFCAFKKGVRPCYAWEPVIFRGGRNSKPPAPERGGKQLTPKDFIVEPITLRKGLTGAKPQRVCKWILELLNVQQGDEVVDLFPGTGVMGEVAREVTGR